MALIRRTVLVDEDGQQAVIRTISEKSVFRLGIQMRGSAMRRVGVDLDNKAAAVDRHQQQVERLVQAHPTHCEVMDVGPGPLEVDALQKAPHAIARSDARQVDGRSRSV